MGVTKQMQLEEAEKESFDESDDFLFEEALAREDRHDALKAERAVPPDDAVKTLSHLARMYDETLELIAENEANLARLHKQLDTIREDLIPERMMEFGIKKLILDDGAELSYKPFYKATLLQDGGYDWLEKSGYAGAVKTELKLEASRIDKAILDKIKLYIIALDPDNLSAKEKTSIHHMTMSSILKELTLQGKDLPKDLFNTYVGHIASIKRKPNG